MAKLRRKNFKLIGLLMLFILIIPATCACGKKSDKVKEGSIQIYYVNKEKNKLISKSYSPQNDKKDTDKLISELLERLQKAPADPEEITAIPENVKVEDWHLQDDNTLDIDFNGSYAQMKKVDELLCRAAVVLTMTQLNDVEYVYVTSEKQPVTDGDNNNIGIMKATDFTDSTGTDINMYENIDLTLYYADSTGEKLVPVNCSGLYKQDTSMEKYIVDKLIKGPSKSNLERTVPSNLKLLSVTTKDGVCYLNFDDSLINGNVTVSSKVEIYSIVNSLSELSYISKVQISINGDTNVKLDDSLSLDKEFIRNLDIVDNKDD